MNNPIEYIEKCTLNDLLEFRKLTVFEDKTQKNKLRNSTRWKDLIYIGRIYLNCSDVQIAKGFKRSETMVRSQISVVENKGITYRDQIDDLVKEIAYWKYKQLNNE